MVSLAGVLVVRVARDADNVTDLLDSVVGVTLEGEGGLALLLIDTLGASAFATSGTRRRQTCIRALTDQVALKLGQRCEDVEDQLPPEVVVSSCSCKLRKPTPRLSSDCIVSTRCVNDRPSRSSFHTTSVSPARQAASAARNPGRSLLAPLAVSVKHSPHPTAAKASC